MRLGMREFRERVSELAAGSALVSVTNHNRVVGVFTPIAARPAREDVSMRAIIEETARWQREWKARTPDWRERLIAIGITDPDDLDGLDAALDR